MAFINLRKVTAKPIAFDCEVGGTQIIIQRHCDYDRKYSGIGSGLVEESAKEQEGIWRAYAKQIKKLPPEEQKKIKILFVASPTAGAGGLQRSVETTKIARQVLEAEGINPNQIINNDFKQNESGVLSYNNWTQPKMFGEKGATEADLKYFEFLKKATDYNGDMRKIFAAFEDDIYKDVREQLGAEGPKEIVERMQDSISAFQRFSKNFHEDNPNHRLLIIGASHYDTLSPMAKWLADMPIDKFLGVNYCAGISVNIDKKGKLSARINDSIFSLIKQGKSYKKQFVGNIKDKVSAGNLINSQKLLEEKNDDKNRELKNSEKGMAMPH